MYIVAFKPDADIAYLSSAIIRDAMENKFRQLFGRDPVRQGVDLPLKVEDTVVPHALLESVDQEISGMLRASAVEVSKNTEGTIPAPPNSTLLYSYIDSSPASISLDAVKEYREMPEESKDATLSELSESPEISVANGMAYVKGDLADVEIAIFVDNRKFAEEFQRRLVQSGGNSLEPEAKEQIFDELVDMLPGGDEDLVNPVKEALKRSVGVGEKPKGVTNE